MSNPVGRPKKFKSVKEMSDAIDSYFENEAYVEVGDNIEFRPTMTGLCITLEIDRQTLLNYSRDSEFFDTVKKARDRVSQELESRLYGNNVAGLIFNLKNNFGWKDRQEVDNTSSDGSMTPTRIERKIVDPK